jgi:hypothetical protein
VTALLSLYVIVRQTVELVTHDWGQPRERASALRASDMVRARGHYIGLLRFSTDSSCRVSAPVSVDPAEPLAGRKELYRQEHPVHTRADRHARGRGDRDAGPTHRATCSESGTSRTPRTSSTRCRATL